MVKEWKGILKYLQVVLIVLFLSMIVEGEVQASRGSCEGKWELATDDDFSGTRNGGFNYVGSGECVEIPHKIKGVNITSYSYMFSDYYGAKTKTVKGVKSTNKNVTDMSRMFRDSQASSLDLSRFDTSSVTDMRNMFYGSQATTLDLSNFDTSSVTDMNSMFSNSQVTSLDLSSFDTSSVTDMSYMFSNSNVTSLDVSKIDTSKVTTMASMFSRIKVIDLDVGNFDTSNVTIMSQMFYESDMTELDISNFNTSKVTSMFEMFKGSQAERIDVSNFDTTNVVIMYGMFQNSNVTLLDLGSFDISNVMILEGMFGDSKVEKVYVRSQNDLNGYKSGGGVPIYTEFIIKGTPQVTILRDGSSVYGKEQKTVVDVGWSRGTRDLLQYQWTSHNIYPDNSRWVNFNSGDEIKRSSGTGDFYLHIKARSVEGIDTGKTSSVFKLDNTPPTVSLSKNGEKWETSHTTSINASDEHSGISKIEYKWTTSTTFPTSGFTSVENGTMVNTPKTTGKHYLHVRATDKAGNERQFTSSVYRVDRTAPTIPIINGNTEWKNSNQIISIIAGTDSHSGMARTEYRIDNGTWINYSSDLTISKEGTTKIDARTIDNVGNVSSIVTKTINIDKTPPTIRVTPSTTGLTHADVTLDVKVSDTHSGVKRVRLPSGQYVSVLSLEYTVLEYTVKENGEYVFEVEDNAGNKTSRNVKVTNIDKTMTFTEGGIKGPEEVNIGTGGEMKLGIENITIKDWREDSAWSLGVKAAQLQYKQGTDILPKGTMKIGKVLQVDKVRGEGGVPSIQLTETVAVDTGGVVEVVRGDNSRGEYSIHFIEDALGIHLDMGKVKAGQYESILTWLLYDTPLGN